MSFLLIFLGLFRSKHLATTPVIDDPGSVEADCDETPDWVPDKEPERGSEAEAVEAELVENGCAGS